MNFVSTSSAAQPMSKGIRAVNKRACAAIGERCETSSDCCDHEADHCVRCFPRFDLIVTHFGGHRCGCENTGSSVVDHPELGRCNGLDRHSGRCRHRYN